MFSARRYPEELLLTRVGGAAVLPPGPRSPLASGSPGRRSSHTPRQPPHLCGPCHPPCPPRSRLGNSRTSPLPAATALPRRPAFDPEQPRSEDALFQLPQGEPLGGGPGPGGWLGPEETFSSLHRLIVKTGFLQITFGVTLSKSKTEHLRRWRLNSAFTPSRASEAGAGRGQAREAESLRGWGWGQADGTWKRLQIQPLVRL